jgi:putative spermidine/putrescine transport system substrate-binding protein
MTSLLVMALASVTETRGQEPASPQGDTVSSPSPADPGTPAESTSPAAGSQPPAAATAGDGPESEGEPAAPSPRPEGPVVVVSWGGVYSKSQQEAIFRPFTRATGIQVEARVYAGDLDQLRAQIAEGSVVWDIVDVEPADAEGGCSEGLFERLSFVLPAAPDGTAAAKDFLPGTLHPCAVGSLAWAMVIAHSLGDEAERAEDARPDSLQDFFDLTAFPGGRGLRRTPMANLEWALMADGVPAAQVYDLLRTEAGVERAFAKLDTIKEAIVWWEDASTPARLLDEGRVAMTSTYNAPIFNDIAVRQRPFALLWDGQVWDIDLWAIPAGAPHREAALEFLRFAINPGTLARQSRWIPYGPVRRSAVALVDRFALTGTEITPYLPTAPGHLDSALRNDALFWREQGPALVERFNAWLAR